MSLDSPKKGSRRYGPARFPGAISYFLEAGLAWQSLDAPVRSTRQCPGPLGTHPRSPRRDPLRQLLLMEIIHPHRHSRPETVGGLFAVLNRLRGGAPLRYDCDSSY
jgi:hypothetical protein